MQKESETWQQQAQHDNAVMDNYLAKELETQNTCPICYEVMVSTWVYAHMACPICYKVVVGTWVHWTCRLRQCSG